MTKPVAYLWKTERGTIIGLTPNDNSHSGGRLGIPLYTAEDLHPRVKMTQAEFDEFIILKRAHNYSIKRFLIVISNKTNNFPLLRKRYLLGVEKQLELSALWVNYTLGNREETIEIVPDMKWFVRSIVVDDGYYYYLLKNNNDPMLDYEPSKKPYKEYMNFDTKEEAELWTNPLTEAVQLPVEGE